MKVCELMAGDLVLHDGKVIRVDAVHKRKISYHKTKEKLTWLFSGQFKPIPLTPEILEKNGFEHIKQKVIIPSKSQEEVEVEYMYCKGLPCSFDIIHGYLMFNSNIDLCSIRMLVNYVHELQHLLKLCGIDKEIVV
jgi:hypothetical protein